MAARFGSGRSLKPMSSMLWCRQPVGRRGAAMSAVAAVLRRCHRLTPNRAVRPPRRWRSDAENSRRNDAR
ncbi:hypothetical protein NDU88_005713 [Pleurodeles waltl]|uniref:Uncharacterized protein n=1 Tax=Pleurodeles waltl TaxID=8319 RepID=A0AAV7MYS8_PLEWA|nr:hypothetical protein NDU88_005713 [Pleurodeles waltl]